MNTSYRGFLMFTEQYVDARIMQIADKIKQAMMAFNHSDFSQVDVYINRMYSNDFVVDKPLTQAYRLKMAKRLARYYIKHAIEYSPIQKKLKEKVHEQYLIKCKERIELLGYNDMFSFESWSKKKLSVNYADYKVFFQLTP